MQQSGLILLFAAACGFASTAWAAHPLITEDTGTQGKGNAQLELNTAYGWDQETDAGSEMQTKVATGEAVLSFGARESLDVAIALLHVRVEETVDGDLARERGLSDAGLSVKWRFWELEHFSFAFKPGLIIPLGSVNKGLGSGKYGSFGFLIASQEAGNWSFHENIGYIRHNNRHNELQNIYQLSAAAEYAMTENLKVVANICQEKNPDAVSTRDLTFVVGGLIYALDETVDIDVGYQAGLSDPELDSVVLAGLAIRF